MAGVRQGAFTWQVTLCDPIWQVTSRSSEVGLPLGRAISAFTFYLLLDCEEVTGHVLRMRDSRIPRQAIQWELRGYKRKPGRPRKNWTDIIRRDLKDMDITWNEAEELATDRAE